MNVYFKILVLTFLSVAILHFGRLGFILLSFDNEPLKHYPGKCEVVKGFKTDGAEDMTLLPSGKLIVTSGLVGFTEAFDYTRNVAKGKLYVMDTNSDMSSVEALNVKGWPADVNFEPHGIDHWVHENKSVSLYVVMHMPERVVRFLYDGKKTVTLTKVYENSAYMRNINSVFMTGEDSFYLTNLLQARFRDSLSTYLEFILFIPKGNILYVEGNNYMSVADSLSFSNGLTGDARHLYVATKEVVRIYTRNPNNTLELFKTISINIGSMDNLKLDAAGDLWIGCQTIFMEALEYLKTPKALKCHSTVIRVRDPTGAADVESVFADDTSLIQAATVAVYTKNKLLIGSVVDTMVSCDVNYLSGK